MSGIGARARFDLIRYAQVWEDADVLCAAFGEGAGRRFLSICSAGDNALALLLLDPAEVVAADLSMAQLECLRLRIAALHALNHGEFLELMGARPSNQRVVLLERTLAALPESSAGFWRAQATAVARFGAGGVGRFEHYFRLFRRFVLPLIHRRATVMSLLSPRALTARAEFYDRTWDNGRWRLLTELFFSKTVMGRLGRDPAFFQHAEGSAAAQVRKKSRQAAGVQDPSQNPYLHWILTGRHGAALPLAWRAESYPVLRERTGRLKLVQSPVETAALGPFDGFNLSDIFEYMPPEEAETTYRRLTALAAPGARLVYWNMMVPRRAPPALTDRVRRLAALESDLAARDKAFFYADLVIEEIEA
jgi:S-adenosylmethionine-diacylglycerol 3-amino-3-carboxypropyl transferase